jgi:hypothetical protein
MSVLTRTRIRWWAVWLAVSVGGQMLGLQIVVVALVVAGSLSATDRPSPLVQLAALLYLFSPFVAYGVGAVPQALLLQRRWALSWGQGRTTAWTLAGAVSGLLFYGYLVYDISSPPGWSDVFAWYLPVTACVALLVTLLQAAVLWGMLRVPRLLLYVPVTTLGWVVGWCGLIVSPLDSGRIVRSVLDVLAADLGYAVPFVVIAAASGLVLAVPLASGARRPGGASSDLS